MKKPASLRSDTRAATVLEFALVAPVFIMLIMGIAQMGLVFFANAGLHNALAEGARHATLFPRPTAAEIRDEIDAAEFGLDPALLAEPTIDYDLTASPNFADIEMSYTTKLNFIILEQPVTLTQSRRVYLQTLPAT